MRQSGICTELEEEEEEEEEEEQEEEQEEEEEQEVNDFNIKESQMKYYK
jgi:hypothetical protein